jgi:hypothetical protein
MKKTQSKILFILVLFISIFILINFISCQSDYEKIIEQQELAAKKITEESATLPKANETKPPDTTIPESTEPIFTIESKLNELESKYSLDFKNKMESIVDKTYLDALLRNVEALKSLSNFYDLQKFDNIIERKYSTDFLNILNKSIEPLTQERKNIYIDMVQDENNLKAVCINFIANDEMPSVEVGLVSIPYKIHGIETINISNAYAASEKSKLFDKYFFGENGVIEKESKFYTFLKETMKEVDCAGFTKKQFLDLLKKQLQREDVGTYYINFIADSASLSGGVLIKAKENPKYESLYMDELFLVINKYAKGKIINIYKGTCYGTEDLKLIKNNNLLSKYIKFRNVVVATSSSVYMTDFTTSILLACADPNTKSIERYNIATFNEIVDISNGLNGTEYDETSLGKAVVYYLIDGYKSILFYDGVNDLDPHRITNTDIKDNFAPLIVLTPGQSDYFTD